MWPPFDVHAVSKDDTTRGDGGTKQKLPLHPPPVSCRGETFLMRNRGPCATRRHLIIDSTHGHLKGEQLSTILGGYEKYSQHLNNLVRHYPEGELRQAPPLFLNERCWLSVRAAGLS